MDKRLLDSKDPYIKEAFGFIFGKALPQTINGDETPYYMLSANDIDELSQIQFRHVQTSYLDKGITFESPQQAREKMRLRIVGDSLYNQVNGIGTLADPNVYTHSSVPVMFGPFEASSEYAIGGLPAQIIDKKTHAMCLQGATFLPYEHKGASLGGTNKDNTKTEADGFWTSEKIKQLEDAATTTGFNDECSDAISEAFIYGGSILYPVFKWDSPSRYATDLDNLKIEKGDIQMWKHMDRWNITIVPNWIVTAKDYMNPRTLYLPQGAFEINTSRVCTLRPKPQPYWIAMINLGWCPSDFEGWIRAYHGYEITCQSIPVMAQQMSLVLYRLPLDQLNATLGADKVKELMQINEEKMREWSAVNPKAVNMIGEVEVVDRTYSGFDQFIGGMKSDLAAQCGIPEPALWHTPNKGFSDNTTESLLKQSETLRMLQHFVERSMAPATSCLIAHVFGKDSKEWEHRDTLRMSFARPEIATEKDKAEMGARFAATVSSFCQAGVSPDVALKLSTTFFPSADVTDELMQAAKKSYEEQMKQQSLGQMGGGAGHSVGVNKNTGKGTKPGGFQK